MTSTGSGAVWRRTMAGDCGGNRPAVDVTVAAAMVPTEQRGRVGEGCNGRVRRGDGGGGRPRRRGCRPGGGGGWAPAEPQGGAERPDGARRDPAAARRGGAAGTVAALRRDGVLHDGAVRDVCGGNGASAHPTAG